MVSFAKLWTKQEREEYDTLRSRYHFLATTSEQAMEEAILTELDMKYAKNRAPAVQELRERKINDMLKLAAYFEREGK